MRPLPLALLSLPLLVTTAAAKPSGGGNSGGSGGGGGALSKVSSGIGSASRGGSSSSSSSGGSAVTRYSDERIAEVCYDGTGRVVDPHDIEDCRRPIVNASGNVVYVRRRARVEPAGRRAIVDFYAGAQKVHDSDGSASIELAVTDQRFRVTGTYTRYFERLGGGDTLTMAMPTLLAGVRIDDLGATSVFLEGGVVHVRTDGDQMGDTKLTGPIAGMRVEHALGTVSVLGDVQQLWFDNDIRATAGRVGVRYGHVQASFRVLDFNVGPPLYGPEVGVRF